LVFAATVGLSSLGCTGCATALLEGVLVADGHGGLAVQTVEGNEVPVQWQSGVGIGRDGDKLTLTNWFGQATAHEGEFVRLGGGQADETGTFGACGPVSVRASPSPTR
jgi:hypothetical protein